MSRSWPFQWTRRPPVRIRSRRSAGFRRRHGAVRGLVLGDPDVHDRAGPPPLVSRQAFQRLPGVDQDQLRPPARQRHEWIDPPEQELQGRPHPLVAAGVGGQVEGDAFGDPVGASANGSPYERDGKDAEPAGQRVVDERDVVGDVESHATVQPPRDGDKGDLPEVAVREQAEMAEPALGPKERPRQVQILEVGRGRVGRCECGLDSRPIVATGHDPHVVAGAHRLVCPVPAHGGFGALRRFAGIGADQDLHGRMRQPCR